MWCCGKRMYTSLQVDADGVFTELHECPRCFSLVILVAE